MVSKTEDSLKKRYLYKVLGNIVSAVSALVLMSIVPRALGPAQYGNFSFLTNFFQRVVVFFDSGTSLAFYNKVSKNPKDYRHIVFYGYYAIAVASIITFALIGVRTASVYDILWPDQEYVYICAAAVWAVLMWYSAILRSVSDAYALTVSIEKARMIQRPLSVFMIVLLFYFKWLNLSTFFLYHYILIISGIVICMVVLARRNGPLTKVWNEKWTPRRYEIKKYGHEYYKYCSPLLLSSIIGVVLGILDRWILQEFSGSVEQGFYALSFQISAGCLLLAGAMTPLLMREYAIAHEKRDMTRMRHLFHRYMPLMYSITAFFSCFIFLNAGSVVHVLTGTKYSGAITAVAIMALYPIYQMYGQLSSSIFFAMGKTKLYGIIAIIFTIIGLPITYFLIAPTSMYGLNSGATGLVIKMVGISVVSANVQVYFNAKHLKVSFLRCIGHQIMPVLIFIATAAIARYGVEQLGVLRDRILMSIIASGMIYTLVVALYVSRYPAFVGLKKEDVSLAINRFTGLFNR